MSNSRIINSFPNSKVSAFQTGMQGVDPSHNLRAGQPIGLLLVLTYSGDLLKTSFSDFRPTSKVSIGIVNSRVTIT